MVQSHSNAPSEGSQPVENGQLSLNHQSYVLYAEDNAADYLFFKRAFARYGPGQHLEYCENGSLVKEFLLKQVARNGALPNLIILDIKMPGLSGLEVLEFIRGHKQLKHLPVVLLSASGEERDLRRAYSNRVNAYLIKPDRYEDLKEIVQAISNFWIRFNRTIS